MAKEINCFKDFLSKLSFITNEFQNLAQSDKKAILDYILKNSPFLSYLTKEQNDFLTLCVMNFLNDYIFLVKYNPEQKEDFEIPFKKLYDEVKSSLNKFLLDILEVMKAKNIYQSSVNSFCYSLEQRLITNANQYLKDIFSELFTEMENCIGGIYSILGKAAAKNKNLECWKAAIIVEYFIYSLIDKGWGEQKDLKFFAEILAHYKREK